MKLRSTWFKATFVITLMNVWFTVNGMEIINEHEPVTVSNSMKFEEKSGEAIYHSVCQGCHMSQGEGAKGAVQYPALASNFKLASSPYPIYMILKGQGAMPSFSKYMDDKQIAEVVNYIRSHFGNEYSDKVANVDVKNMR